MNAEAKDVESILRELASGKIFSVKFRKRTDPGTIRHMTCRFDVSKGIKGKERLFEPNEKGLIGVWDIQKRGYRFISVEGITEIRVAGESYTFEEMST
jgi:hypothetical protein